MLWPPSRARRLSVLQQALESGLCA
jgi:hypothetical protein